MINNDIAIVLIECQNEFCSKDGALYNAVKEVLEANKVLENIKNLLDKAREKCRVIHVPIVFQQGYPEISAKPYGILKGVVDSKAFLKGSKGSEFYDDFKPINEDIIADGKKTLSAFSSSNLDTILRANDIKKIAFAGFLTNVCVEATARMAYDLGYEVFILSDCTASTSMEEQQFAVNKIFPLFAKVLNHQEFISSVINCQSEVLASQKTYYS